MNEICLNVAVIMFFGGIPALVMFGLYLYFRWCERRPF